MRKQLDVNFGDERIRNCGIGNTIKNKEGNDGNRDRDIYREGKRYIQGGQERYRNGERRGIYLPYK